MATWTKAHDFLQRGSGVRSPVCPKFQIVATKPFRSGLLIGGGSHPVFGGMAAWQGVGGPFGVFPQPCNIKGFVRLVEGP